jgi:hypothetical protein
MVSSIMMNPMATFFILIVFAGAFSINSFLPRWSRKTSIFEFNEV